MSTRRLCGDGRRRARVPGGRGRGSPAWLPMHGFPRRPWDRRAGAHRVRPLRAAYSQRAPAIFEALGDPRAEITRRNRAALDASGGPRRCWA
ncbi:MAG: hypothetical protein JXM73_24360 [Anaerolineae bacterium]|nr:hypothetical protein [Anaerolineae bacterium]